LPEADIEFEPKIDERTVDTAIVHRDKVQGKPTSVLERSGPDLKKAIASVLVTPPAGVAPKATKPQQGDVTPAQLSELRTGFDGDVLTIPRHGWRRGREPNAETVFHHPIPSKDAPAEKRAEFVVRANNVIGWMQGDPAAKAYWEGMGWTIERLETISNEIDPTESLYVDPTPTAPRGVSALAAAQEEIDSLPAPQPTTRPMIHSAGEWLDPEQARVNYAWALYSKLFPNGNNKVFYRDFLPAVPAIPSFLHDGDQRFTLVALVVDRKTATLSQLMAAAEVETILDEEHLDPESADALKQKPYWIRCQYGDGYRGVAMKQVISALGRNERILSPREALCLTLQYPSVLPEDGSHSMDLLAGEITLQLSRKGRHGLLEDRYPGEKHAHGGAATRVTVTGVQAFRQ
jgi:hypothetical protein